jgi:hypothetical protein
MPSAKIFRKKKMEMAKVFANEESPMSSDFDP